MATPIELLSTSMLQNLAERDTVGTLEEGLEPNLLNVERQHSLPLLDRTFGEVQVDPSNVNPASGGTFQAVGSVPGGSLQCNRKVLFNDRPQRASSPSL
jgi:hypothetical protein